MPLPDTPGLLKCLPGAATFVQRLDNFLDRFGERNGTYRGSMVSILTPTWVESIETVLALVAAYLEPETPAPKESRKRAQAQRDAEVERLCAACADEAVVDEFRRQLSLARRLATIEETHNHYIDQLGAGQLRLATLEAGERLAASGAIDHSEDTWWLHAHEIVDALRESLPLSRSETVRSRQAEQAGWELLGPPPVLGAPDGDLPRRPPFRDEAENGAVQDGSIRGQGGCRGRGNGPARVIELSETAPSLRPGDILVAVNAGPAWTPYFPILAGIVLDEGSFADHATAVAREYGVPVVFGTREASKHIAPGQWLLVDGTTGEVELSEPPG